MEEALRILRGGEMDDWRGGGRKEWIMEGWKALGKLLWRRAERGEAGWRVKQWVALKVAQRGPGSGVWHAACSVRHDLTLPPLPPSQPLHATPVRTAPGV